MNDEPLQRRACTTGRHVLWYQSHELPLRGVMRQLVLLLATVALVSLQRCPSYDTLDTVYLPRLNECSWFWRCLAGTPVPGRCPSGLHFTDSNKTCVPPEQSGCPAASSQCPSTSCSFHCTCLRSDHRRTCPSNISFPAQLYMPLQTDSDCLSSERNSFVLRGERRGQLVVTNAAAAVSMCDVRAGQVYAPHFADCSKGVHCTGGREELVTCTAGSVYNAAVGSCDKPENVKCKRPPRSPDCSPLSECRHTCTCEVLQGECPARLRFGATVAIHEASKQLQCLEGSLVVNLDEEFVGALEVQPNTTKVNHCPYSQEPQAEYFADPSDCQRMFLCQHGRETSVSCPRNQYFDPASRQCGEEEPDTCLPESSQLSPSAPSVPEPAEAIVNLPCPTSESCPAGRSTRLSHLTDCTLFCRCLQGAPFLRACPPGLHFNPVERVCDVQHRAGCKPYCERLAPVVGGEWNHANCINAGSALGEECRLKCERNYQLMGSQVIKCTDKGWHGTGGLNIIPSCYTPQQVAADFVDKVNSTLMELSRRNVQAALLFILDESTSVKTPNFQIEKDFVSALVKTFPLSQDRAAGVVTFSKKSAVDISVTETSTCDFITRLNAIRYSSGRTNIAGVLDATLQEIDTHAPNKTTLVFLITDGKSQTDPVAAADVLRSKHHILFTIGVARYERQQMEPISSTYTDGSKLFFGLPNFRVFRVVADYLRDMYTLESSLGCP